MDVAINMYLILSYLSYLILCVTIMLRCSFLFAECLSLFVIRDVKHTIYILCDFIFSQMYKKLHN